MNIFVKSFCLFLSFGVFQLFAERSNTRMNTKKTSVISKKRYVAKKADREFKEKVYEILKELRNNPDLLKAGGEVEKIQSEQGSIRVSNAETASQEAKEWDSINRESYNVKRGFIKFPGSNTYLRIYGFGQLVAVATRHQNIAGYTADYSLFPEKVAKRGSSKEKKSVYDYNMLVNESRLGFETYSSVKMGNKFHSLKVLFEFDLNSGGNGSNTLSNKYQLNMRHAYFSFDNFIFGQTTTIFSDPAASAETMNGPVGSTSKRTIQAQYLHQFSPTLDARFAIEKHIAKNDIINDKGERVITDHLEGGGRHEAAMIPAVLGSLTKQFSKGHISGAVAVRQIRLSHNDTAVHKSVVGFAGRISGSRDICREDSVFGVITYGSALGHYVSDLEGTILGVTGTTAGEIAKLKAIRAFAIEGGIRHFWTHHNKVRSTLAIGYTQLSNRIETKADIARVAAAVAGGAAVGPATEPNSTVKSLFSATFNVMMTPLPNFDIGLEYSYGEKRLEDRRTGTNQTLMFLARVDF